jgi:hypothetical protein
MRRPTPPLWLAEFIGSVLLFVGRRPSVSTGIHGGITYGYGPLDSNGYFAYPVSTSVRGPRRLYYAIRQRWTARVDVGDNWAVTSTLYDALVRSSVNRRMISMHLDGIDRPNCIVLTLANGTRVELFARYERPRARRVTP